MKKMIMLVLIVGAIVCGILVNSEGYVSGMYPSMYPVWTPDPNPVCPPWICEPTPMPEISVQVQGMPVALSDPIVSVLVIVSKSDTIIIQNDSPLFGNMLMRME